MSRLPTIVHTDDAHERDLLADTQRKLGRVPNLYRTMVGSPAALQGYLSFRAALDSGAFDGRLREQLAIAVAAANGCGYCVAAHQTRGSAMGIEPDELARNRAGSSDDQRTAGAVHLAQRVVAEQGRVSDTDLATAREAGLDDGEIAEVIAHVALNTFSNWFNHVAQPELDFPAAV